MASERDPLPRYTGWVVLVGFVGWGAAWLAPSEGPGRFGAFLGVAAATFSGVLALLVKRWAVRERHTPEEAVTASLKALGAVFGVRLVMVLVALLVLASRGGSVGFTVGFFGAYVALQWIEIGYVLAERKRGQGRRD